jgi:DegV family protein with EDD domain
MEAIMKYQILMDSGGDLPEEMKKSKEIVSIPLRICIGTEEMLDDERLDSTKLLKKIHFETGTVASACPSPYQYVEACDKETEHIYIITGSSRLTGSYSSARLAAEMIKEDSKGKDTHRQVCVIDSKSASAGQTLLAMHIAQWEEEGASFLEIRKRIKRMVHNMQTRFIVESLDMLEKTGRLTGVKARIANTLHICPILHAKEGVISQSGQARGIRKALSMLEKQIIKEISGGVCNSLVVSHCHCLERAYALKIAIHEKFPSLPVRIVPTKGIASMYAGKGGLIVAYAVETNA